MRAACSRRLPASRARARAALAAAHDSQVSPGDRFLEALVTEFAILVQGLAQVLMGLFPLPLPLVNDAEIAERVGFADPLAELPVEPQRAAEVLVGLAWRATSGRRFCPSLAADDDAERTTDGIGEDPEAVSRSPGAGVAPKASNGSLRTG
jgi:hypothetical protein